ncbi:ankyrin repeat-containing domain protein, partial [Vararia minispora EC-137]
LHRAVRTGDDNLVRSLLAAGEDIEARDDGGSTALHIAAKEGRVDIIVRLLLDGGADIDALSPSGMTALHYAVLYGHIEIISILLDRGASV